MKRVLLVAAAIAVLSSGCAAFTSRDTALDDIDVQKVAQIDHLARSRGLALQWVNYPQRKTPPVVVVVEPILPTGT